MTLCAFFNLLLGGRMLTKHQLFRYRLPKPYLNQLNFWVWASPNYRNELSDGDQGLTNFFNLVRIVAEHSCKLGQKHQNENIHCSVFAKFSGMGLCLLHHPQQTARIVYRSLV